MKPEHTYARTRRGRLGVALAALLCLGLLFVSSASADYEQVGNFAQSGNGEQLWNFPSGMAINISGAGGVEPGSVYASTRQRVSRYNAKGEIKEVWGWHTIASGPDLPNQVNTLEVNATSGTYELEAGTASGVADYTTGSNVLTKVWTETGAFHVGDLISNPHFLLSGTTVTSVGSGTIEVSTSATGTTSGGDRGFLGGVSSTEITTPIPYNASTDEVQEALLTLPAFEAGDVSVAGTPGNYEITFEGSYAGTPVRLDSTESTLTGGVPSSTATIKQTASASSLGFQRCQPDNGDVCVAQDVNTAEGEGVGQFSQLQGVTVDQETGYVYVINKIRTGGDLSTDREHNLIEVFNADGSEIITRFGDFGTQGETGKLHEFGSRDPGRGDVVDEDGRLYLSDLVGSKSRVMCFRPQTVGDYEHYVYCGSSQDLKTTFPERLALDNAGHLYVAEQGLIEERSPAEPSAHALCTYLTHGQLTSMTTNPLTGEVFYFNSSGNDLSVHRLKPCDPAKGTFEEAQAKVKPTPVTTEIFALAFNPSLSWGPERPAGVLYAADQGNEEHGDQLGIGDIFAPAKVHSPTVESEAVSNTRTTSAILSARIDPHGFGTRYVIQYLTEARYEANPPGELFAGAIEAPVGGGEIGGGSVGEATAAISGLAPDTAYRFRVVATSECNGQGGGACVSEGEALSFATYPLFPPGLPDHRVYELVSPAQKHGGEVIPADPSIASCSQCKPNPHSFTFPMQSSPDGEALAYEGQPFNPFEGAVNYDSYVARRTASGWQSTPLIPALPPGGVSQLSFDAALGHGLLGTQSQLELQPTAEPGARTPLIAKEAPNRAGELTVSYGGHSADFSRQFFAANDTLTEATPFAPEPPDPGVSKNDLYEWHEGQLAVVNVLPGNTTIATGAKFASISADTHAVSEDGSRVYFEDEAGNLYARIGGTETVRISQSQRSTPDPVGFRPVKFVSASPDGSRVLFSSAEELSDDADTGPIVQSLSIKASGGSFTLGYEGQTTAPIAVNTGFNPQKPANTEVREALEALSTIGVGEVSVSGALQGSFQITRSGAMAASDALIEANGSGLTGGTLSLTASRSGSAALYEWHNGTLTDLTIPGHGGFQGLVGQSKDLSHIYFVDTEVLANNEGAGLDSKGNPQVAEAGKNNLYSWSGGEARFVAQLAAEDNVAGSTLNDWASNPSARTAEVSPNGRFLAFASLAPLSGYDNVGPCGALAGDIPCTEAFLYDSASGKLACASCNPTGEAPLGNTTLRRIQGAPEAFPQPRYLTDEGRLYFDTRDSLSARDTNEGVEDVYEFASRGTGAEGTCEREAGCTRLISAGTEAVDSNLIAVDETGKNVFFDTRDKLALKDKDELLDIYDAREGGGIAAESEIARAECQGENCQLPVSPPNDPTPGSSTFEGAGNVKEAPAAKKHSKKKHSKKHKKKAKKHSRTAKRNHGGAK
jgi:hypothetical protein